MKKAIFPGSFDPFHQGHEFIVKEALKDFEFLYIIISWNESKKRHSSFNEAYQYILEKYKNDKNIKLLINESELTTTIANKLNCFNIVRGYRNKKELILEKKLYRKYVVLDARIKVFYYHSNELKNVSSTIIRKKN